MWNTQASHSALIVFLVTVITGLPGNLLSFYAFVKRLTHEAKPTDVLLLSLNISDLIFLLFLPIHIKAAMDGEWMNVLCPLAAYIFLIKIYNTTLTLAAISVERYLGVVYAIKYKLKRHPRYAVITSVVIWVINLGHCSIVFYMQYNFSNGINVGLDPSNHNSCYFNFTKDQLNILLPESLAVSILAIFIPLIICFFCYISIMRILYKLDNIKPMKCHRALGLAMSTILIFLICSLPFGISHVFGFIHQNIPTWRVYTLFSCCISVCLDPIVFYCSSKTLHYTFKDWVPRLYMCLRRLVTDNTFHQTQQDSTNLDRSKT